MINITEKEFKKIAEYVKANYGIHLKNEKKSLVVGRLQNVLIQNNCKSFSEYYDHIVSDKTGNAVVTFLNKLTTNHTFFMREADHFTYFKEKVLPYFASRENRQKDLRVWSAGCSTGEEAYTLAMILDEFFGMGKVAWDTKVLATDISTKVLETAMRGIYGKDQIQTLPPIWKNVYFQSVDPEKSTVIDKIKNEVIFRRFNLMNDVFPFKKKFHTIFCRNVMIYFDQQTKRNLVNKFYEITEPGGYLFIGHSESIGRDETKYKYIMPAVYRKE